MLVQTFAAIIIYIWLVKKLTKLEENLLIRIKDKEEMKMITCDELICFP